MTAPATRSRRRIGFRTPTSGPAALAVAAVLLLAGCSSSGTPSTAASSSTTSTTASDNSSTSSTTTSTAPPSTTSSTSGGPQNLLATPALKSALTAVYVTHNSLPANEVAGTAPGSVYYAYEPVNTTYWAIASFVPTSGASSQTQVAMQDEGCCGVFTMTAGGSWIDVGSFLGAPCPGQIPADLESLWNLQYPGSCPSTTTTTS
jgi:hypothetical protein